MRTKITKRAVDAAQPGNRDVFLWDTSIRGFGLKVTPNGSKTYLFQYRMAGRGSPTRRYTIGKHGSLTPDEARSIVAELPAQVARGNDPAKAKADERRQAIVKRIGPVTFGKVAETYIMRHCPTLARGSDIASVIRRTLLPAWGARPVAELRRRDAIDLLDRLMDAGKPGAALKLRETITGVLNWAHDRDMIDVNPITKLKAPVAKVQRARVLVHAELRVLWPAFERMGYPWAPFYQLLLLTAARREEVARMRWCDVDLDKAEWLQPTNKSDRPFIVPLSDAAVGVLNSVPRFAGGDFILSTMNGRRPISGYSKAKAQLDKLAGVENWRAHDIRRTVRSELARLGVPEIVCERLLNHAPRGLAGIYNRHEYATEKRAGLERWAHELDRIINPPPDNVMTFKATA